MIHIVPILNDNYAYVIEGARKQCLIIDSGDAAPVISFVQAHSLKPVALLSTHHHGDHVGGNIDVVREFDIPVIGPATENIPAMTRGVREGDVIAKAGIELRVMETPGHTKGHVVFYAPALNALFSGDTLFSMGCGRLFEGSAQDMFDSLQKLKSLPPDTNIYCGHEYTKSNGDFARHLEPDNKDIEARMQDVLAVRAKNGTTIPATLETEMKTNPFLRAKNVEKFAILRSQKDIF